MEKNNFIHVTTCEEGFEKCHELCKQYDLRIQEHYPEDCYYCLKEQGINNDSRSEGTFKILSGKFSSLYEKMGQRLKDLVFKKNQEFVVEDDIEEEDSLLSSTFPDFDPNKIEDSAILHDTTERRLKKILSTNKSDEEKDSPFGSSVQLSFDSKSRQVSINDTNKVMPISYHKKSKKDFRNRSSEFSKNELKMVDPTILHRNSNDLYRHKNNSYAKNKRRMYASGFALNTD